MRSGKVNVVGLILIVAFLFGLVFLHTFGPYYWDYVSMGEVVKNTALSCQDRDEQAGKARLTQELAAHEIPTYIEERNCTIRRQGDDCTVSCAWTVAVAWPFTDIEREMSFNQQATRGPHSFKD
jgi:hypothetical protein